MRVAIDANSKLKTALAAGKDSEGKTVDFGGKMVTINSAAYGYENMVNSLVKMMNDTGTTPKDLIFVWDGVNSSAIRCAIDKNYKGNREERPPEYYHEYQALRNKIMQVFLDLGSCSCLQENTEADDVLAYLAENIEEDLIIESNDGDLAVLNGVNKYGAKIQVRANNELGINPFGEFDHKLITLYKALVGDKNDSIDGCVGFGIASFRAIFSTYKEDGMFELLQTIADNKIDSLHDLTGYRPMKLIWEQGTEVYKSYRLAKLYPEWVETGQRGLKWQAGLCKAECEDERLQKYAQKMTLVGSDNYDACLAFLQRQLQFTAQPTLDIETSAPPESDDWLAARGKPDAVDVLGQELTGFSITFGRNNQFTYYVMVDHKDSPNILMSQARRMIQLLEGCDIHNTSFEGSVLYQAKDEDGTLWRDHWKDNGYRGFIKNWDDTMFMASYVDENSLLGLKWRSENVLGYKQVSYEEVTQKQGWEDVVPAGGRIKKVVDVDEESGRRLVLKQYKMNELTGAEVFHYGADDTICTAALGNFYRLRMQLEHTWGPYRETEIDASYLHALSFVTGFPFSLEKMNELIAEDDKTYNKAYAILREYLISKGWAGTTPPVYTQEITVKQIKEAFTIVYGLEVPDEDTEDEEETTEAEDKPAEKHPFLSTRVRTPAKMATLAESLGYEEFGANLRGCLAGQHELFTNWVNTFFTGEPKFKISPKQMSHLMYEVMGLEVKVRNKATAKMKAEGRPGNPKTDALAIAYALASDASPEIKAVLEAIKLVQMVKTRRGLYYTKYPNFIHWKTGLIHYNHKQCSTNTRRGAGSDPNTGQMPKHPKIEGEAVRFRECVVPHKKNAVVASFDFDSQELRIIAEWSGDTNLVACYVGENKKGVHDLTGLGIFKTKHPECKDWTYEKFIEVREDKDHPLNKDVKTARVLGKKVNFTVEYLAQAPKVAMTLLITEEEAQDFIDAREEMFPEAGQWKKNVIEQAKSDGYVRTLDGAVRHLRDAFQSEDYYEVSKAERQAVNTDVQGSGAAQTKRAEGQMWRDGLFFDYDSKYYFPVHDECVASIVIEELPQFMVAMHRCMTRPFAKMKIPIESGLSFGPNFGQQVEIGFYPTPEAVAKGVAKVKEMMQ